jgi:hypothetical protein
MEYKLAENLKFFIEEYVDSETEVKIYENYSGKGMFGKTTTGIEVENPYAVFFALGMIRSEQDKEEIETNPDKELLELDTNYENIQIDSLGIRYIVY